MDTIFKTYDDVDLQVDEGKREVISVINTDSIDRDGEVVQPKGIRKKNYQGNPIVMVNHDYRSLPVGSCKWIKASTLDNGRDALVAKTFISDKTQMARDVFGLMQDGVLKAFSVGFQSYRASPPSTKEINIRPDLKSAKLIHRDWDLHEYSVVGIPCNPDALAMAVSKGYSPEVIDVISGKNAAGKAAAEQIVEEVTPEIVAVKKTLTESDLLKMIAKSLDRIELAIDHDKVIAAAMRSLKHIA